MSGLSDSSGLGGGGGGTSATAVQVSFSTTLPLDSVKYMPEQIVSGPLTFTVGSSPAPDGVCSLSLIADGTNAPAFSGLHEAGVSSGYNDSIGIRNYIRAWYEGVSGRALYSVFQEVGATGLQTSILSSATVPNAAPSTLTLVYNNALDTGSVPATSAYSVSASGGAVSVSSVGIASATVTLNLSRTIDGSETVTVSYTVPGSNPVRNLSSGVSASALTNHAVTNSATNNTPVLSSATIANATPTQIALLYSVALDVSSVPATSAFSVSASGGAASVSSVGVSGSTVTLTLGRSIAAGETVTVSYTVPGSNKIKSNAGAYYAAALSNQSVTNDVTLNTVLRFTNLSSITESSDATFGFDYTCTGGTSGSLSGASGVTTTALPSSQDGYVLCVYDARDASNTGMVIALKTSSSRTEYAGFDYGVFYSIGTSEYYTITSGGATAPDTSVATWNATDIIRIRRAGSTVYGEVSQDGGTNYTVIKTWTGASTAALYAGICGDVGQRINAVGSSSNWA